VPWSSSSLIGDFALAPGTEGRSSEDQGPTPSQSPRSEAAQAWASIKDTDNERMLEVFIRRHPDSVYAEFAKIRLEELQQGEGQEDEEQVAVGTFPDQQEPQVERCDGVEVDLASGGTRCMKPGSGWSFKDCAECPEMVVVPAGSFIMGSPESEEGRDDDEGPQHEVTIPEPFAVGKFEVTWDEWGACVAAGGCDGQGVEEAGGDNAWGKGNRPVIEVSWDDAQAYVKWLSDKTGKRYRLLSEAEWEYAARAGTTTRYAFGDNINKSQAQFSEGSFGSAGRTVEVGSFGSNRWGLHDVHGNVWEWVADCWNASYAEKLESLKASGEAWTTGDCNRRVLRGGSWYFYPQFLRSASRVRFFRVNRGNYYGFRLTRTLGPVKTD
jgi:formylglycine-generating enzyme required for sulfatase activity